MLWHRAGEVAVSEQWGTGTLSATGPNRPAAAPASSLGWQPVLDGEERTEALTAVAEIAAALGSLPHDDASLAGGTAGRAVLHARLVADDPAQRDAALACLRHAAASLRTPGGSSSLFLGAAGTGWVVTHLAGELLDARDRCASLDRALLRLLDRQPWPGRFDLVTGLVGLGVYALERLDVLKGTALLERVVRRLGEMAVRDEDEVYWWTRPQWLNEEVRTAAPSGQIDLGLAHGIPGPIALLGAACAAGVASDVARGPLEGAVACLLREAANAEHLSYSWQPGRDPSPARTAWCYGEPGVASALLIAARGAGEPAWEEAALALARRAASRSLADSGVVDAGVCHGAAGLGLIFARLHHATGDPVLGDAARSWFERTLELRQPGTGIGGFATEGPEGATDDPGLLTGATGIGLALHAAASDQEPTWDRILLLSATPVTSRGSGLT